MTKKNSEIAILEISEIGNANFRKRKSKFPKPTVPNYAYKANYDKTAVLRTIRKLSISMNILRTKPTMIKQQCSVQIKQQFSAE